MSDTLTPPLSAPLPEGGSRSRATDAPARDTAPLSLGQRRLWFLQQLQEQSPAYTLAAALRLEGPFDFATLAAAVDAVRRRHDVLRTRFQIVGDELVQTVTPWRSSVLRLVAPADLSGGTFVDVTRHFVHAEMQRPFDLRSDEPLRVSVLQLAPADVVVVLVLHHLVADAWSLDILVRELGACYKAAKAGAQPALEPLALQYIDVARREAAHAADGRYSDGLEYWAKQLAATEPLALPMRLPRHAADRRAVRVTRALPAAMVQSLAALGRRFSVTPYMTLLAAFQLLLGRFCHQRDVTVGTSVANRVDVDVEPLIGFFVNILALRTKLSWEQSFAALVHGVRATALDALAHQNVPFDWVIERLRPARLSEQHPIFQVFFNVQRASNLRIDFGDVTATLVALPREWSQFDLEWEVVERDAGFEIVVTYAAAAFEPDVIDRLVDAYFRVLEQVLARPELPLSEVSIVPRADAAPLRQMGRARGAFAGQPLIHQQFAAMAAARPDAIAIVDGDRALTFAMLGARAGRLAARLRRLGVGPDTSVALCITRRAELVVGMLGILEAGGAYVPIDPEAPAAHRASILAGVRPRALVVAGAHEPIEELGDLLVVDLENEQPRVEAAERDGRAFAVGANAAYILHTSGSTGRPKGVIVTHDNVARHLAAMRQWIELGPHLTWTLFHNVCFDISVWEIWACLTTGGRLVIVPKDIARAPSLFAALIERLQVTTVNVTPSVFKALVRDGAWPERAAGIESVLLAGEAVDVQDFETWFARFPVDGPRLANLYGPTETTIHATYKAILPDDLGRGIRSPIGIGVADLDVHVLDACGHLAPHGVVGEIVVGGAGVARGYLHRADLTAARFIPDAWGADGGRLYRTGDLGRRGRDGALEFLGRIDHQVKVRGFRIEPEEIEGVLKQHPGVRETVVVARQEPTGAARLVAYVVSPDGSATGPVLRAFVARRLPEHMVPSTFVPMSMLPITPNGKLDRAALPNPNDVDAWAPSWVAPQTTGEQIIADIWQQELRVARIGLDDNVFDRGAHSLLLERVHRRLQKTLDQQFPLVTMFECPTVRTLADRLLRDDVPDVPRANAAPRRARANAQRARRAGKATPRV